MPAKPWVLHLNRSHAWKTGVLQMFVNVTQIEIPWPIGARHPEDLDGVFI